MGRVMPVIVMFGEKAQYHNVRIDAKQLLDKTDARLIANTYKPTSDSLDPNRYVATAG